MLSSTVLIVVSWALLAVFVLAFALRTIKIARLPIHLRWELAPVPHEKGRSHYGGSYLEEFEWWTKPREKDRVKEVSYMFQEILLLKSVWEHNRRLWWFSFPFHLGLYVLIGAGGLLLVSGSLELGGVEAAGGWHNGITVLAAAGFALGGLGALGLLVSRFVDSRFREYTTPAALFNLILLLAVFVTGGYAIASSENLAAAVWSFGTGLVTGDMAVELSAVQQAHVLLALLFLAYLPFSRMMHFVAKYFTYHDVRWDDRPREAGSALDRRLRRALEYGIDWSAAHARTGKTWAEVATTLPEDAATGE